jgi:hypothetical protein
MRGTEEPGRSPFSFLWPEERPEEQSSFSKQGQAAHYEGAGHNKPLLEGLDQSLFITI